MENIVINIESPVKYYDFKDQHGDLLATFRFVPSDLDVFDRHKTVLQTFERMQEELKTLLEHSVDRSEEELTSMKNKYANELKESFDYLFNSDTSGFFAVASPFTPLENGDPWALIILESVMKIITETTGKNMEAAKNNSEKYTAQYNAGPGKYPFPVK